MRRKNYYLILGISRSDAPAAIRRAYRDLAHRYHPDRTGPDGTHHFQEINEAYEVLSDPDQRAAYDREAGAGGREAGAGGHSVQVKVEPLGERFHRCSGSSGRPGRTTMASARKGPIPEPMIPDDISVLRDFGVTRPSEDALYDRFMRNFARDGLPKSGSVEPLTVELRLAPDRARRGGLMTLALPVFNPCPVCKGTGSSWAFGCLHCNGAGMLETEHPVRILAPPPHAGPRSLSSARSPARHPEPRPEPAGPGRPEVSSGSAQRERLGAHRYGLGTPSARGHLDAPFVARGFVVGLPAAADRHRAWCLA